VLRTGSKPAAASTLLLDALKGTIPVSGGLYRYAGEAAAIAAAFGAFIGHIFPVWLKFKGGKGVATYAGILLGFGWPFLAVFAAHLAQRGGNFAVLVTCCAGGLGGCTGVMPSMGAANSTVALALCCHDQSSSFLTHRANISTVAERARKAASAARASRERVQPVR
jgi:glycerol-3-phosphate acyltransferase PlsY